LDAQFWQRFFFYKSFYIAGADENNWLIKRQATISTLNGVNTANVTLQFNDIYKKPAADKALQLQIMNGSKNLYKQTLQTDQNGLLDVNFKLPEKSSNLVIVAESEHKDKRAIIPINLNRAENIDLQFLPEGGNLVAGLPSHIGFKAIGEDGKGIDISGVITDHNQKQVAEFKSVHNGIGSFDIVMQDGENYYAKVTLPGGTIKEYPLPIVKSSGTVLHIKNPAESDSVQVSVLATNDILRSGNSYFLIGKARGIICYAAIFSFHEGNFIKRKIAKRLFPAGITHFTLMTTNRQPLNERLVYIDHHDNLDIQFTANKPDYQSRDSIALKIKVTDYTGKPVEGNFSFAVTDDTQVKTDALNDENIVTRMLLTSDLKGYVEGPGYYLSSKTNEAWQALDNLLLTHGWVGYDWSEVFNPPVITYQPEYKFMVKGNVLNVFNKPVKGTDVLLFSKSPAILMDTTTDKDGKFVFDHFPRVDTPMFVLKAVNKNGKSYNVGITVDEIKPPEFAISYAPLMEPWYVNSDATLLNYGKSNAFLQQQDYFPARGHRLKEVKIKAKKIIKDSQNLNGPGNADIALDEKDLEKAGKKNWLQLLQENIKGFRDAYRSVKTSQTVYSSSLPVSNYKTFGWYYIDYRFVRIIIDGIELNSSILSILAGVSTNPIDNLNYYLKSHNAEDIKGIEVIFSDRYADGYERRFGGFGDMAFIEITTRSGHGPYLDNTPGMYLYKPLPICWPKQFYKPKYTLKDTIRHLADLRSTIDWEPNITTGINGEAKLFFYTADKPSTYTLIIEGADMNGNLGYKLGKIIVGSNKPPANSKMLNIKNAP